MAPALSQPIVEMLRRVFEELKLLYNYATICEARVVSIRKVDTQLGEETRTRSGRVTRSEPRGRRCGICGTAGHNARTCEMDVETSGESDSN